MQSRRTIRWVVWAAIASCVLQACSKSEQPTASEQPPLPRATVEGIEKAIDSYESIAKTLSEDRGDVQAEALALAGASQAASMTAPESLKQPLEDLSASSEALAALAGNDLPAARKAFGDVSRAMIELVSAAPSLQQGLHGYQCPMVEGYNKWVQTDESISNPYMGGRMPKCGSAIDF